MPNEGGEAEQENLFRVVVNHHLYCSRLFSDCMLFSGKVMQRCKLYSHRFSQQLSFIAVQIPVFSEYTSKYTGPPSLRTISINSVRVQHGESYD